MVSSPLSIRFDPALLDRLRRRAAGRDTTPSGLAQSLIDEGLRSQEYPGIVFRDGPSGRRVGLAAGPDVWEVVAALRDSERRGDPSVEAVAADMNVPIGRMRVALAYHGAFSQERHRDRRERAHGRGGTALVGVAAAPPGMTTRLLVDEHYSDTIAAESRELGHDVVSAVAKPDLRGASDPEVFRWAAESRRRIVTENVKNLRPLLLQGAASGTLAASLLLVSPRRFRRGRGDRAAGDRLGAARLAHSPRRPATC